MATGLAIAGGIWLAQAQQAHRLVADAAQLLPARNDFGRLTEAPAGEPVAQARDCRIAKWGQRPYLAPGAPHDMRWHGDSLAALQLMGIPLDAAAELTRRISAGTPDDQVRIGNGQVVGNRGFSPYFATTYQADGRRVVCHGSRANHRSDAYREPAALYVVELRGIAYYVAVPPACQNITRLMPAVTFDAPTGVLPAPFARAARAPQSGYPLLPGELPAPAAPAGPVAAAALPVNEPSALPLALIGLAGAGIALRRRKDKK